MQKIRSRLVKRIHNWKGCEVVGKTVVCFMTGVKVSPEQVGPSDSDQQLRSPKRL